ncbi:glutathione S-transferase [Neisseria animaloris]|uniref:glutathione S-transferase N-terminal domain-containing protein n=1 Tax=Neisseria animaloris TaxID=326522 RepID=UPI001E46677B|nr:glutathione S-transferase [Neisseria animaloris]
MMKLWYSTTSPYVRKVRAVAAYHGLEGKIELMQVTSSFDINSPHNQDNPLGRIPALQADDGEWFYNSNVIAEYLDSIGQNGSLYPQNEERWKVLNIHALAEGIMENTLPMIAEKMRRPENEWWTERHQQIKDRNAKTLAVLAEQLKPFGTQLNIGTLNAACVIEFVLFLNHITEVASLPCIAGLKEWQEEMNRLYPCLSETKPYISN